MDRASAFAGPSDNAAGRKSRRRSDGILTNMWKPFVHARQELQLRCLEQIEAGLATVDLMTTSTMELLEELRCIMDLHADDSEEQTLQVRTNTCST